jgi:hypothetical protein
MLRKVIAHYHGTSLSEFAVLLRVALYVSIGSHHRQPKWLAFQVFSCLFKHVLFFQLRRVRFIENILRIISEFPGNGAGGQARDLMLLQFGRILISPPLKEATQEEVVL